jgi:prepilin-type N-terminal cleavage/methylation domain-containing protein
MTTPHHAPPGPRAAFTLIEMLLVIAVILILIGMLIPAAILIMKSAHKSAIATMVQNIDAALNEYQQEDPRHYFPPAEPDTYLYTNWGQTAGSPPRVLDLLTPYKLTWKPSELNPPLAWMVNPALYLDDDFGRPYCYTCDTIVAAGVVTNSTPWAPATQPTDWNAKNEHPHAYVWSFGKPTSNGDASDEDPTRNIANWIYVKTSN